MTTDHESVVVQFFDEWGKPGGLRQAFGTSIGDTCVWENTGFPPAVGKEAIMAFITRLADALTMDRIVVDVRACASRDGTVLIERVDHLETPDGRRTHSVPVVGVLEVRDGKIERWSDYFDPRPFLG